MRAPMFIAALALVASTAAAEEATTQADGAALETAIGLLVVVLYFALIGIPVARILHRAGYSRWLTLLILVPIVNIVALLIWAFEILPRAGYSRWLALLLLVSPVNIVLLWIFAFAKWTVSWSEERDRSHQLDNWSEAEKETFRNLTTNKPPA
jgi:hypothetical protein